MTAITVRTKIARCYAGETEANTIALVAETRSGRRFLHSHNFRTLEGAQRRAEAVKAKGTIDLAHWAELDPVYGSSSWLAQAAEAASYKIGMREGYVTYDQVPEALRAYL